MRNVVLLTLDSLRADHCGFMGYERNTTPTLDEMVADGVVYENALSVASCSLPSAASFQTGRPLIRGDALEPRTYVRRHLKRNTTIAKRLSEKGYTTVGICPNPYASRFFGFQTGFDRYEDFCFDNDLYQQLFDNHLSGSSLSTLFRCLYTGIRREEVFKTWDTYIDRVVATVAECDDPFFLWIFSLDPHFPYLASQEHRHWAPAFDMYYYNWKCARLIGETDPDLDERMLRRIIDVYDNSIRFTDAFVRALRTRLAEYDPVFVIHGDHGESFAEHGVYGHFYPSHYEELLHVPLLVSGVDQSPETIERPASLVDPPRLMDELSDATADTEYAGREWVTATNYDPRYDRDLVCIRLQDWKYGITRTDGSTTRELYDLATDPGERDNLAGDGLPIEEPLRALAERRRSHEREVLDVREASRNLNGV